VKDSSHLVNRGSEAEHHSQRMKDVRLSLPRGVTPPAVSPRG
jgi:hypothetical protein